MVGNQALSQKQLYRKLNVAMAIKASLRWNKDKTLRGNRCIAVKLFPCNDVQLDY